MINFRCYDDRTFLFTPRCNIIVGNNAIGKTSLVEAIYCLCFGKSFKNIKDNEILQKEKAFFRLEACFENNEETDVVTFSFDSKNKRIEKNNKTYKNTSEYIGYFNIVVFSPDDLELVKGAPTIRRQFLDIHLSQMSKKYLLSLIRYKKILKERNELLKQIKKTVDDKLFDSITEALIREAHTIIETRAAFIEKLNPFVEKHTTRISFGKDRVNIGYKPHTIVDNLSKTATENKERDWAMQTTTWGPTRDDIEVEINGEQASVFGSQGQIRTICLAMKMGLAEMMRQNNERTLIILDDVFSELDVKRQNTIISSLNDEYQTFITTTTVQTISKTVLNEANIIEIKEEAKND